MDGSDNKRFRIRNACASIRRSFMGRLSQSLFHDWKPSNAGTGYSLRSVSIIANTHHRNASATIKMIASGEKRERASILKTFEKNRFNVSYISAGSTVDHEKWRPGFKGDYDNKVCEESFQKSYVFTGLFWSTSVHASCFTKLVGPEKLPLFLALSSLPMQRFCRQSQLAV